MRAADAMNADGTSDATQRSPSLPDLTGKLVCSITLQILHNAIRSKLSNCIRASCPLHSVARRVCCSTGTLKEAEVKLGHHVK